MRKPRGRAWGKWLVCQGREALTYVVALAFAVWLVAILFEGRIRQIDGLSAAIVSASSDFHLRRKECQAWAKSRAQRQAQRPGGVMEEGEDVLAVPGDDCRPDEVAGSDSDAGSDPRSDKWDVTVVLFGDADLDALELPYPVPYRIHAEVLETLLAYEPAAIFVDFMFLQERKSERDGAEALRKVLVQARDKNVPVVMALPDKDLVKVNEADAGGGSGAAGRKVEPWLADRFNGCADFAALTPLALDNPLGLIRYPAESEVGLRVEPAPVSLWRRLWNGLGQSSATAGRAPLPTAADVRLMPLASPAFAVADALDRRQARRGRMPAAGDTPAGGEAVRCLERMPAASAGADHRQPSRPAMDILWRTGVNERRSTVAGCGQGASMTGMSVIDRLSLFWAGLLRPLTILGDGYSPEFCPFQPVVSANALLAGDLDEAGRRARFTGRVIVYGANFLGALDAVKTPAGAHTPGVFIHAMAIHNLLLLGDDGYKVDSLWRRWVFDAVVAFAAALFAVLGRNRGKPTDLIDVWARPQVVRALRASNLRTWANSFSWTQRAKALGAALGLLAFVAALFVFDRIVTVALVVSVVLLWKLDWRMLAGYVMVVGGSALIGFAWLRQGSLGILLVLGLLLVARKTDEGVGWFAERLREVPDQPDKDDSNPLAFTILHLDRLRQASDGPPPADHSPPQSP